LLILVGTAACSDEGGSASQTTKATTATTEDTGDDAGTSTPTSGAESGAESEVAEICVRYIDCIVATVPEALPAAQAGFGEGSMCWSGSAMMAMQCIDACKNALANSHEAFPTEQKCSVCVEDSECAVEEGEACLGGDCVLLDVCGNGVVEADEICDSGSGCGDDCVSGPECSPLTQVGCGKSVCFYHAQGGLICVNPTGLPGNEAGEGCTDTFDCAARLACIAGEDLSGACASAACCVPYCDLAAPTTCAAGLTCRPLSESLDISEAGTDYLGICVM
jgi:hypothetical protein